MIRYKRFTFILTIIIITYCSLIFGDDRVDKTRKQVILNNIKPNNKYKVSENIEIFKKFFIGWWGAPPHSSYYFYNDGTFIINNSDLNYKGKKGNWFINEDKLYLKFVDENKYSEYNIEYYYLELGNEMLGNKLDYYNLYIKFDRYIKWDYVNVFVLQFNVN